MLCKNSFYHFTPYIGQAISSSQMFKCKFFVVQAQLVKNSGVKIINMNGIFYNIISKLVGFAITGSWFYSSTRHPDTITTWMMIPSIIIFCKNALAIIGSTEFTSPYYQCLRSEERRV